MRSIYAAIVVAGLSILPCRAFAEAPVARDYDVRSLIIERPDFTDAPDLTLGATLPVTQPSTPRSRAKIVASLIARANQLSGGSATEEDGTLHVLASEDGQGRLLKAMTAALHDTMTKITIESRFLAFNPAAAELDATVRDKFDQLKLWPDSTVALDKIQAGLLMRAVEVSRDSSVVTAPRLTLFQDQRAYLLVSTHQSFVAGVTPTKSNDGQVTYEPKVDEVNSGIMVNVRAHAAEDRTGISLDYTTQLAQLMQIGQKQITLDNGKQFMIQVPDQLVRKINHLLTLQSGQYLLMTIPDRTDSAAPHATTRPSTMLPMFVLVSATVVQNDATEVMPMMPRDQK